VQYFLVPVWIKVPQERQALAFLGFDLIISFLFFAPIVRHNTKKSFEIEPFCGMRSGIRQSKLHAGSSPALEYSVLKYF